MRQNLHCSKIAVLIGIICFSVLPRRHFDYDSSDEEYDISGDEWLPGMISFF